MEQLESELVDACDNSVHWFVGGQLLQNSDHALLENLSLVKARRCLESTCRDVHVTLAWWLRFWVRISLAQEQADLNEAIFSLMGLWLLRIWFLEICMHSDMDEWILNGNTQYFPQRCQIMLWKRHNGGNHADKFDQTYERYFTVKSVWTPKRVLFDMDGDVGMALVGFLCVQKHPIKDTKPQLSSLNVQITKPKKRVD